MTVAHDAVDVAALPADWGTLRGSRLVAISRQREAGVPLLEACLGKQRGDMLEAAPNLCAACVPTQPDRAELR